MRYFETSLGPDLISVPTVNETSSSYSCALRTMDDVASGGGGGGGVVVGCLGGWGWRRLGVLWRGGERGVERGGERGVVEGRAEGCWFVEEKQI